MATKYYGGCVTKSGNNLFAKLAATQRILKITRIMFGSGQCPEGKFPGDMTNLVEPKAEGTSTTPTYEGESVFFTAEFRSDLNGGLQEGFMIREIGVFAEDPDGADVMIYYATLGDDAVPVKAYTNGMVDIRRFPITLTLSNVPEVEVAYNPDAFLTAEDAEVRVDAMVKKRLETTLTVYGTTVIENITIPKTGWSRTNEKAEFPFSIDLPVLVSTARHIPEIYITSPSNVSVAAGLDREPDAQDGYIRIWAKSTPSADMTANIKLQRNGTFEKVLLYCFEEKGLLFNYFSDDDIQPAGETNPDQSIMTFENAVISGSGDVSISNKDISTLDISVDESLPSHDVGNGKKIAIRWSGNNASVAKYPEIRMRLATPLQNETFIGMSIWSERIEAMSFSLSLYSCKKGASLGSITTEFGKHTISPLNDGRAHHYRIPLADFGIHDPITVGDDETVELKIDWGNLAFTDNADDMILIDNIGFFPARK